MRNDLSDVPVEELITEIRGQKLIIKFLLGWSDTASISTGIFTNPVADHITINVE